MPLRKKLVPVLFEGVSSETDEFLQTEARELNNVIFNKRARVQKRNGYTALRPKESDSTVITSGEVIQTYKDELCLFGSDGMYTYYDSTDRWDKISNRTPSVTTISPLLRNTYEQKNPKTATLNSVSACVWEDERGGVRATIYGETSGHAFQDDIVIDATGVNPKLEIFRGYIYLFWVTAGGELKAKLLNTTNPKTFESEITFMTNILVAKPFYDIEFRTQTWLIIAHNNTNSKVEIGYYNPITGDAATPNPDKLPDPIERGSTAQTFLKIGFNTTHTTKTIYVIFNTASDTIVADGVAYNFVPVYTTQTVASITSADTVSCAHSSEGNTTTIYFHVSAALTHNHLVYKAVFDNTDGSVVTASDVMLRSVGLLSEPFMFNSREFLILSYESPFQSTNYVYDATSGVIVGKLGQSIAGGHNTLTDRLTHVTESEGDVFSFISKIKTRTIKDEGTFYSTIGLYRSVVDLSAPRRYQAIEASDSLFVTGSIPLIYDGRSLNEAGFLVYPEDPSVIALGSGGSLSAGQYSYKVLYRWDDTQGQAHRSAPCLPQIVTAVLNDAVTLTIPTLRLTDRTDVIIEVYRTDANGTVHYLVGDVTNDKTVDVVVFNDTYSDTSIQDNEILYTEGSVLQNSAPESCKCVEEHQGRLFIGGLSEGNLIWYSKPIAEGFPPEFSDLLVLDTGSKGGNIVALKILGDNLIVFKENSVGIITGRGADSLGIGQTYEYDVLAPDLGVSDPNASVRVGGDLIFKSSKGFYKIMGNFLMSYIGRPVKDYENQSFTAAVSIPSENRVVFGTDNGRAVVYNPLWGEYGTWTTFTNYDMVSATQRKGILYFARANGEVFKEDDSFSDNGSPIISTIVTSFIKLAGVSGYQRLYTIQLSGERVGNHSAKIELFYSNRDSDQETFEFTDSRSDIYGTSALDNFGDTTPFGGDFTDYFWEMKPAKQRCTSVSIKFEDFYSDNQPSGGFELTAITLELGAKGGRFKGPIRQRATPTTTR